MIDAFDKLISFNAENYSDPGCVLVKTREKNRNFKNIYCFGLECASLIDWGNVLKGKSAIRRELYTMTAGNHDCW